MSHVPKKRNQILG